jgi:hypothetical protein
MKKILAGGVTLALLVGAGVSPVCAMSGGGGHGGGGGHAGRGHGGGGHGGGFHGPGFFHADRFQRRFFGGGLGFGVLGSALLIAPAVYYAPPPIYYTPLPTPCAVPYPPNNYPPQGNSPPQAWLEHPCQ